MTVVPRPRMRIISRIVLPVVLIAALLGTLLFAAREALLRAVDVRVAPVVARPIAAPTKAVQQEQAQQQRAGAVLAQAPGWVEPEPYAVIVQSLIEGVVKDVHVLEGETVEAGDVVATLIDEDAALEVERAEAEVAIAEAALSRAQAEEEVVSAQMAELQDEIDRKRALVQIGGVSEGDFARMELRLRALKAELSVAKAATESAKAAARRAEVLQRTAELELSRTVIRAPVAGVVLTRSVMPGTRISMAGGGPGEAHIPGLISIYDPARLQVRAEVPLADFGKIGLGTLAEVTTEALPGVTIAGRVVRIVHEADIQRNTVQVKVLLEDPPTVLKTDMLTRVRFVSGGEPAAGRGVANAGASQHISTLELLAPADAILDRTNGDGTVWLVVPSASGVSSVARRRIVQLGAEVEAGYVQVVAGLNPGDRLIVGAPPGLDEGSRVRIVGEADHNTQRKEI